MTFKRFEEIFKTKYPDGSVWMHSEFERGHSGSVEKVAVVFSPGGKVYKYRGAYEDVLCRVGINTISKERLAETELRLETVKEKNGKPDFFGGVIDNSEEIERLEAFLKKVREEYVIA